MRRIVLSIFVGVMLTVGVSWGYFGLVAQPSFSRGLGICAHTETCDYSPYVELGIPLSFGRYDDAIGGMSYFDSSADYAHVVIDVVFWSAIAYGLSTGINKRRARRRKKKVHAK